MTGRRILALSLVAVVAGAGAAAGAGFLLAGGDDADAHAGAPPGTVAVDPHAPTLRGTDPVGGGRVALTRVKGKEVVVHVWASWCKPCGGDAAATIQRFAHRHRRDAVVIGVDYQDETEDAQAFYERHGWSFRSIADPDGTLTAHLGVENVPATIVLDESHRIVARIPGVATRDALEEALAKARSE